MLTNGQKKALHSAARQAGLDEQARRTVQRNVGGFHSAADRSASRDGFVAVMAFLEDRCGGCLRGNTPGYWAQQRDQADPGDRLRWRIDQEANALGWTKAQVNAFLSSRHMSGDLFGTVQQAPAYWLSRLLEGMIQIRKRMDSRSAAPRRSARAFEPLPIPEVPDDIPF
ncbi:MAG: hypothetical protein BWX88_02664 [Planctomycetes bacterium ADurb.Bin126]|nr:MAG: hypothetical protein BWX88_02664 [Planctomycetes bacterium ADurb.Bin126]HOD79984.1 hypothetical protein [Phycisphaerae bacterium]HQL74041.1 hypothetical protein [Phycisphaerae bacterium]